ncbi:elongation factor G-binding protein [Cohnella endophytica]|uniref:Elongation factor G-binding protein n=1 Tax=Cohnella endophytica TaxID=2419778 RepID=A0A494YDK5_9BACL|nr:FusB/FusC family EF-G-binding protein [Cohnella endophytica]RKP58095.1 elongation factor G-binding protein [Cohnella endophytica]
MSTPFIRNHHFNLIKNQANNLLNAIRTVADLRVVETVRSSVEATIVELFPEASEEQLKLLRAVITLETASDFQRYYASLEPFLTEFPRITKDQIVKLFPKNKKLSIPDLQSIDYRYVTYLSWVDVGSNKLFIVYERNGKFVGVEGRATPTNKKNYCFVCNKYEELALFSAVSKKRPANASPDYYKAVGNYLCADSRECNKKLTDVTALEGFLRAVLE